MFTVMSAGVENYPGRLMISHALMASPDGRARDAKTPGLRARAHEPFLQRQLRVVVTVAHLAEHLISAFSIGDALHSPRSINYDLYLGTADLSQVASRRTTVPRMSLRMRW